MAKIKSKKLPFRAYTGIDPFIFISYSHEDDKAIYRDIEKWDKDGYRIWYDQGIVVGRDFPAEIAQKIKDCHCFVVFLSENSIRSRFVNSEILFAWSRGKTILPILLDDIHIPDVLSFILIAGTQAIQKYAIRRVSEYREMVYAGLPTETRATAPQVESPISVQPYSSNQKARRLHSLPEPGQQIDATEEGRPHTTEHKTSKAKTTPHLQAKEVSFMLPSNEEIYLCHIPAGMFWMGSDRIQDPFAREDEMPLHQIYLDEYWIGKYPITQRQYQDFVIDAHYLAPQGWQKTEHTIGKGAHPASFISWYDAQAFCEWLTKVVGHNIRLPSEAEWEKAARGDDKRLFPWGVVPPDKNLCNVDNKQGNTTPVSEFGIKGNSPYGCRDMAGNVWEWTRSLYDNYPYSANDGRENKDMVAARVLRGGSYYSFPSEVRCASRFSHTPEEHWPNFGFRIVVNNL